MIDWYFAHITLVQATFLSFLVALSIQVPMRFGVFSFAGVAAYGVGAYTTAIAIVHWELPTLVAIVAGIVAASVMSLVLALILQRLTGLYLAMATISVTLIVGIVANNGGELTGGPTGLFGVFGDIQVGHLVAIAIAMALVLVWAERGRMGRRISAVREDPELAGALGINVPRYRIVAFMASGFLGSLAGGLEVIMRTTIAPTNIGFGLVVTALTVIIVGGIRSWLGAAIGAVLVTWLPYVLEDLNQYQHIIYGVLVVLAAIFVPGGLLGIIESVIKRFRRRGSDDNSAPAAALPEDKVLEGRR